MKRFFKVALVLLCVSLAVGALASCGGGGETPEWKPTGAEITLIA